MQQGCTIWKGNRLALEGAHVRDSGHVRWKRFVQAASGLPLSEGDVVVTKVLGQGMLRGKGGG